MNLPKTTCCFILFPALIMLCFNSFGKQTMPDVSTQTEKKTIKILAIDGGGIRGIIPLKILAYIEKQINKQPITHYFDIMSGTSAGGIIVLFLNIPDKGGYVRYSAEDILGIYKQFGKSIFHRSSYQVVRTMNGWIGDKYSDETLKSLLGEFMGNMTILDSVKDIVIPAYDIGEEKNYFFRKIKAATCKNRNFYMRDVARATSAAPTYFKPAEICDVDAARSHIMVDGGISVNNPALSGLVYGFHQYNMNVDYMVVSIGTGTTQGAGKSRLEYSKMNIRNAGKLGWAKNIIPLLMDAVNEVTDYEMKEILPNANYYRLQVNIEPEHSDLDNASDENIKALEDYSDQYIRDNKELLDNIAKELVK